MAHGEGRPVLRLVCDDDFARRPENERKAWADDWIRTRLTPALSELPEHVLAWSAGMDYARHRHFSVFGLAEIATDLMRHFRLVVEMANVPTRQQEQILWAVLDHPRLRGRAGNWVLAMDATGPGQTLAEYTADRYGAAEIAADGRLEQPGHVIQVSLSRRWYAEHMRDWVDTFEDQIATYPCDAALADDFRAVEEIDGIPMLPPIERKDLKDPDLVRHGDGAIMAALAWYASHHRPGAIAWTSAPAKSETWSDGRASGETFRETASGSRAARTLRRAGALRGIDR
jgi:phage FluMu gp28-like protein